MPIKVLVIDDQQDNLDLMGQALEDHEIGVVLAPSGAKGLELAGEEKPDVIILDVQMPGMDGYEVCRRLKEREETRNIPIIFLTASETTEESLIKGLELGAFDYLMKPIREKELIARINVMARIKLSEDHIRDESYKDVLTGLFNRRYLDKRFNEELFRARRGNQPLACLMLDLDHFKSINDLKGHPVGDFILKETGRLVQKSLRKYDTVARYGGEEFVIILAATTYKDAMIVAEKIRKIIDTHPFEMQSEKIQISVSIGVYAAEGEMLQEGFEQFIRKADEALYKAKGSGRNRVIGYDELYRGI